MLIDCVNHIHTVNSAKDNALHYNEICPSIYKIKQRGGGRVRKTEEGYKRKTIVVKMEAGIFQYKPAAGSAKDLQIRSLHKYLTEMEVDEDNWYIQSSDNGFTHPLLDIFEFSISSDKLKDVSALVLGENSTDKKGLSKLLATIGMTSKRDLNKKKNCIQAFFNPHHWNEAGYKLLPGGHVGKRETAPLIIPLVATL